MPVPRRVLPSQQPAAIGYIRLAEADPAQVIRFRQEVADCCCHEALRLVNVFWDADDDGRQLDRVGLRAAILVVQTMPALNVVVPDLDHLSPHALILGPILLAIHRAGGRVITAREPIGDGYYPEDAATTPGDAS